MRLTRLVLVLIAMPAFGCNQRTPILDVPVTPTGPSGALPAALDNIARIAFAPPGNRGGAAGTGTIYLDTPARSGGRTVTLRSADESIVTLSPPTLVIPEGATSADFAFSTRAVLRDVNVTVTATSDDRVVSDYVSVWTATTSFLAYTADPGVANTGLVYRLSSDAGGRFSAGCDVGGGGLSGTASGSAPTVSVIFAAPRGQPMLPGIYDNATNTGGTAGSYLSITSALNCQSTGRVELHEVSLLANGSAASLWFSFEQRCLNKPGSIRGTYRMVVPDVSGTGRQCVR